MQGHDDRTAPEDDRLLEGVERAERVPAVVSMLELLLVSAER